MPQRAAVYVQASYHLTTMPPCSPPRPLGAGDKYVKLLLLVPHEPGNIDAYLPRVRDLERLYKHGELTLLGGQIKQA